MVKATRTDPRRFNTSQAIPKTYGGKPLETGPSGYGKRLPAVMRADIELDVPMDASGAVTIGDLTEGMVIIGLASVGGASQGTVTFALPLSGGQSAVTLITGATVAAGAKTLTAGTFAPIVKDRPITATPSGGAAGEINKFLLSVAFMDNGWF